MRKLAIRPLVLASFFARALLLLATPCLTQRASADQMWLVSNVAPGATPASGAWPSRISADGEWVVVTSQSPLDVPGIVDVNGGSDAFLVERATGLTQLISHAAVAGATTANGASDPRAVSADGRYVAFSSSATDLVAGVTDGNGAAEDTFLWDRETGLTVLVSHVPGSTTIAASGRSYPTAMSADGRYVTFASNAPDLIAGGTDTNVANDAFLWDRDTAIVRLISHVPGAPSTAANGGTSEPSAISGDGRYVAFYSQGTNLIAGGSDANGSIDAFLWDRDADLVTLISHAASSASLAADGLSLPRTVSGDGRYVGLLSFATDLLVGGTDTNAAADAFLWDRDTGLVSLISHPPGMPNGTGDQQSEPQAMSADGRYVAFVSSASDLVAGGSDPNGTQDAFLWDRETGLVRLVSHAFGSSATAANESSDFLAISADGRAVSFGSYGTDLIAGSGDGNGALDAFRWDRDSGAVALVSHASASNAVSGDAATYPLGLSADGRYLAIASSATDLVAGVADSNQSDDAFLADRDTDLLSLLSRSASASLTAGNGLSYPQTVSADGRYVAYASDATDLVAGGSDGNSVRDAFLWDRLAATTRLISHLPGASSTTGNGSSETRAASADGRYVAFVSYATDLIAGGSDTNGVGDAFLWDRDTDAVSLVSHVAGASTTACNGSTFPSDPRAISADGRYVAFLSRATNLIAGGSDTNAGEDAYLWDRDTGLVSLISHAVGTSTTTANGRSAPVAMSADGHFVVFYSAGTDLVSGGADANGSLDVFLWERDSGDVTLVSHVASVSATTANGQSIPSAISADGSFVVFYGSATNLVAGGSDFNGASDAFLWSRVSGLVSLISHAAGSSTTTGSGVSETRESAVSGDGRYVTFYSLATNLIAGGSDTNAKADVFLWDRDTGTVALVSHAASSGTLAADDQSLSTRISADGRFVAFQSQATNLIVGATNSSHVENVYHWARETGVTSLVTHRAAAFDAAQRPSYPYAISADGLYVALYSDATNLVAGDVRGSQAYLWSPASDVLAPGDPLSFASSDHSPAVWSNDSTVAMQWSGAADEPGGAGLAGYSLAWTQTPSASPDHSVDVNHHADPNAATSLSLADASNHYAHLATCDRAGNCTSTVHAGPFWIDTTAPIAPGGLTSPSHTVGAASGDPTIEVTWTAATDATSGVNGYAVLFDASPTAGCDQVIDENGAATGATSNPLPSGTWYAHVCAVDTAGNWGAVANAGPYTVDATAPTVTSVRPVAGSGSLAEGALLDAGVTQLLVAFSEPMATSGAGSAAAVGNYSLFAAAANHVIDSTGCGSPAGDDVAVPLGDSSYLAASQTAALTIDHTAALAASAYRLFACGSLIDAQSNALDGNADTTPGDDFGRSFTVQQTDLLANPNFDLDTTGWTLLGNPGELSWQSADADVAPTSGSAQLVTIVGAGQTHGIGQCLAVTAGEHYRARGQTRIASGMAGQPKVGIRVELFASAACTGSPSTVASSLVSGDTAGGWRLLETTLLAPAGAVSARVRFQADNTTGGPSFTVGFDDLMVNRYVELLFMNGFEGGSTGAWSGTVSGP